MNGHRQAGPTGQFRAQQATSSVALLMLRLIRWIDKNCLGRSLKLKLYDGFFVQRPYEMRLASGYDSECADLSNFGIGGVKFFALAVVYLAAQDRSVFRIRVSVRRSLSVWWKLESQNHRPGFGRITVQQRCFSSGYERNVEPFQFVFVNGIGVDCRRRIICHGVSIQLNRANADILTQTNWSWN